MLASSNYLGCLVVAAFLTCNGQLVPDLPDLPDTVDQLMTELQNCRQSFETLKSILDDMLSTGQGQWSDWGPFSTCSATCYPITGNVTGTKTRTRTCENAIMGNCPGESTETVSCAPDNLDLCPVTVAAPRPEDDIGGAGGWPFNDESRWNNKPITAVKMTCGRVLVSLQLKYGDSWGPVNGGGESVWCEFPPTYTVNYNLAPGQRIVSANATFNSYINSLELFTNRGEIRKCGTTTGSNVKSVYGRRLMYVSGSAGCYVDGLKLHWAQATAQNATSV